MFNQAQELQSLQQAQLEKALRLSSIVLSSAERFANLQLELSKKLIAEQADVVKTLAEVKDVKSLADAQAQFSQPSVDQVFGMASQRVRRGRPDPERSPSLHGRADAGFQQAAVCQPRQAVEKTPRPVPIPPSTP